ncbi:MAG: hypothetical protein AAGF54_04140 [Pseudomonadota bacterium]
MSRIIFGDENAKNDPFLGDCVVQLPAGVNDMPVLEGRWGVGKTATFFIRHRALMDQLSKISPEFRHIWYLDEGGLDTDTLYYLSQHYASNHGILKRALIKLWRAEIVRVHARQLNVLHGYYGRPRGVHWDTVRAQGISSKYLTPVWSGLSKLIPATGTNIGSAITNAISTVTDQFDQQIERAVQACLKDIEEDPIQPVVVIEPIETPSSALEETDIPLSRMVMVSLLDLFILQLSYSPFNDQRMRVQISVPWHRDVVDHLSQPQKRAEFFGDFTWTKEMLRDFINRRIEKEFEIAKRHFRPRRGEDAWSTLFTDKVRNLWCGIDEDSFDYFVRHTHHRTRDLLRLTRSAVMAQVDILKEQGVNEASDFHVFRSSYHSKISPTAIRKGVEDGLKFSAVDRLTEAKRRFPKIGAVIDQLYGLSNPIELESLKSRISGPKSDADEVLLELWEGGIIGVQIFPGESNLEILEKNLGLEAIVPYILPNKKRRKKYFLFEYNSNRSLAQVTTMFSNHGSKLKAVIHPVFTEYFGCAASREYPIGI